jgi:putative phosphoesterase
MLIAIISDTHMPRGKRRLPDGCVEQLRNADLILHAGDICTLPVLGELSAIGPPVRAIHGNVDDASVQSVLRTAFRSSTPGVPPSAGARPSTRWGLLACTADR